MDIERLKKNNRIQADLEGEGVVEAYKGIVMDSSGETIALVTDYGREVFLPKGDILTLSKCSFPKPVSQTMMKMKSVLMEKQALLDKMQELEQREANLRGELLDQNLLSRFTLLGATNRIGKSIPLDLMDFHRGHYLYSIAFLPGERGHLEMHFRVSNVLEHYIKEVHIDNLLRSHAPKEEDLLSACFKALGSLQSLESHAVHVEENVYEVISSYRLRIELNRENYKDTRSKILHGLKKLRR